MKKIVFILSLFLANFAYSQAPSFSNASVLKFTEGNNVSTLNGLQLRTWLGAGTVSSVGMTVPAGLLVSPATITSTGSFGVTNNMAAGIVKSAGVGGALTSGQVNLTTEVTGLLPNANLANSIINHTVANAGTAIGYTTTNTALGATQTLNVPLASPTVTSGSVSNTAQIYAGTKTFNNGIVQVGTATVAAENVQGASIYKVNTFTTNTTLDLTHNNAYINATANAVTLTLPLCTATNLGLTYPITRLDASTVNNGNIALSGTDTFLGGGNTKTIWTPNNSVICTCVSAGTWDSKW